MLIIEGAIVLSFRETRGRNVLSHEEAESNEVQDRQWLEPLVHFGFSKSITSHT